MIRVYNTLSKSKEPFEPVQPGKVGIYLCGPTVYKPSHIGHMVGPVIFDTIKRYLVYNGYDVTLVVNITDVDDKLIAESSARKIAMADLAAEMTADYMRNIEALGVDAIDHFPRCTENIDEIIDFTRELIDKGFAYRSDGDVYFDVSKDPDYGKLSHRSAGGDAGRRRRHGRAEAQRGRFRPLEGRQAGRALLAQPLGPGPAGLAHRVLGHEPPAAGPDVRHPRRRPGPGLPAPRKRNRPERMLPRPADGQILAAQRPDAGLRRGGQGGRPRTPGPAKATSTPSRPARSASRRAPAPSANCSSEFAPETIRFFLLATHYRRPIDFSDAADPRGRDGPGDLLPLLQALRARQRRELLRDRCRRPAASEGDFDPAGDPLLADVAERRNRFLEAMDDDFNTGGAIGDLFELVRRLNKFIDDEKLEEPGSRDAGQDRRAPPRVGHAARVGGHAGAVPPARRRRKPAAGDALVGKLMELLIELRAEARKKKDFATADRIRNVAGRNGRHAGGPARRHGVEPRMKVKAEGRKGGRRKEEGRTAVVTPQVAPDAVRRACIPSP